MVCATNSGNCKYYNMVQHHTYHPHRKRHDVQTRGNRVKITQGYWAEQLPCLTDTYLLYLHEPIPATPQPIGGESSSPGSFPMLTIDTHSKCCSYLIITILTYSNSSSWNSDLHVSCQHEVPQRGISTSGIFRSHTSHPRCRHLSTYTGRLPPNSSCVPPPYHPSFRQEALSSS